MLVHRRAISHATLCPGVLGRYTLRYRIVGAFQTPSGSQAVFVMDVVGLCECTRTSEHRCKQGGNRKHTHYFPPLFSMCETNSRTNDNGKLLILSCRCRVLLKVKTLTDGALIYVNDKSGASDALAAAGSMSACGPPRHSVQRSDLVANRGKAEILSRAHNDVIDP